MGESRKERVFITGNYEKVKNEMKFKDIFGREIRLSSEVWDHILKTHPELKGELERKRDFNGS